MTSTNSANATPLPAAPPPPSPRRTRRPPPSPAALRRRLEAAADKIIAALDALDLVDEDREYQGDEEEESDEDSLAGVETAPSTTRGLRAGVRRCTDGDQRNWSAGESSDVESDNDCDDEGSLGASEGSHTGTRWGIASSDEFEAETDAGIDDDKGIDEDWFGGPDAELTLGWGADIDQRSLKATDDYEPTLGSLNCVDQRRWSHGSNNDGEAEFVYEDDAGFATEVAAVVVERARKAMPELPPLDA